MIKTTNISFHPAQFSVKNAIGNGLPRFRTLGGHLSKLMDQS